MQLAMLGFALAVIGELTTGRNVFQQIGHAPGKVIAAISCGIGDVTIALR